MNCSNCGTFNTNGSKYCIGCGKQLSVQNQMNNPMNQPINPVPVEPTITYQSNQEYQTHSNITMSNGYKEMNNVSFHYLVYLIAILLKPFQCFKEEEEKFSTAKVSIILTVIVAGIMTGAKVVQGIIATVRETNYTFSSGYTYTWEWSNLKELNFISLIGKNFVSSVFVIAIIALVFYLGNLVIKKQMSFIKSLSISATVVIPYLLLGVIVGPLVGMLWGPLGIILPCIGLLYSFILLYEFINYELQLEGDMKIYFNLICLVILVLGGSYLYLKLFNDTGFDSGFDLENMLDLFG